MTFGFELKTCAALAHRMLRPGSVELDKRFSHGQGGEVRQSRHARPVYSEYEPTFCFLHFIFLPDSRDFPSAAILNLVDLKFAG
jgi:hypothetical protein